MTFLLTVTQNGAPLISCPINKVYGRTLVLFGLMFPGHLQERPQDAQGVVGKLVRTIEDALQENLEAHSYWMALCDARPREPVVIDVVKEFERVEAPGHLRGGDGGEAAWPAGGGGGGGSGPIGSTGGNGAEGAVMLFEYGSDDHLIDIEAFVLPGNFDWVRPLGVAYVKAILFGAGGGGSGGAAWVMAFTR